MVLIYFAFQYDPISVVKLSELKLWMVLHCVMSTVQQGGNYSSGCYRGLASTGDTHCWAAEERREVVDNDDDLS